MSSSEAVPDEPNDAPGWHARALALRAQQRMVEATHAFARAATLAPDDVDITVGHAQTCFASGLPAVHLFRHASALAPNHLEITRQLAMALAAEGEQSAAETLLERALAIHPDWLEGHKSLANMRWTSGQSASSLASYRKACGAQPRNPALRMAWFYFLATMRDWAGACAVLDEGEAAIGDSKPFTLARLYLACESVAHAQAEQLLAQTEAVRDAGVELCRLRYYLRTGQLSKADTVGERLCKTPAARLAWPYRSLIWRLQGDGRADWLDGSPPYVRVFDLDLSQAQLDELAVLLRQLHTASSPYIEQSVRGGTQTDRPLFFRHEPIVQITRQRIVDAVRLYIAALPAADAAHPLLGPAREQRIYFSGSWSVRLQPQGFHVSHTHPMGWISSALYIALPDAAQMGAAPAGWISFGAPPPELRLHLAPYRQLEPKLGRLVLFPSTMWHSTMPFADGERLVVAFDVGLPRS
jgi:cytochrome c-type biogenesis protein CcmH/NrfG